MIFFLQSGTSSEILFLTESAKKTAVGRATKMSENEVVIIRNQTSNSDI
jgi:hypothetical protein